MHAETRNLVQKLVQTDTTRGKTIDGINILAEFLEGYGITINIDQYREGEGNLFAKVGPKATPEFVLSGHMDTVPIGNPSKWSHHPFSGKIVDNNLWGRGSVDMKGGVGAVTGAFVSALEHEDDLQQQVTLAVSSEEEVGLLGAKEQVRKGLMHNATHLLVAEPTGLDVGTREKGIIWAVIQAHGRQAHGSRPDLGVNAIEGLAAVLPKIYQILPDLDDPVLKKTTLNYGIFQGGTASNVVPELASVNLDIRTTPGVRNDDVINSLKELVERESGKVKFGVEILESEPAVRSPDEMFPELLLNKTKSYTGRMPKKTGMFYATDGAVLMGAKEVDFAIFGPGSTDLLHQTNEHLDLAQLEVATNVIRDVVLEVCSTS